MPGIATRMAPTRHGHAMAVPGLQGFLRHIGHSGLFGKRHKLLNSERVPALA